MPVSTSDGVGAASVGVPGGGGLACTAPAGRAAPVWRSVHQVPALLGTPGAAPATHCRLVGECSRTGLSVLEAASTPWLGLSKHLAILPTVTAYTTEISLS